MMGASMSWLVADADQIDRIANLLGLQCYAGDGSPEKTPMFGVTTPAGKIFIYEQRGQEWAFIQSNIQSAISAGTTIYFLVNEEHTMMSSAELWRDGAKVWGICHESDGGIYHLATEGDLPDSFESIRAKRFAEQDQEGGEDALVDTVIQIPLDLAEEFTGYDGGMDEPEGEMFYLVKKPQQGFFQRIFGKKNTS